MMKHVDEFRDRRRAEGLLAELERTATRPWVVMEVCGGQTHSILKYGLDALLPEQIELAHGPGCPVCVTPIAAIDRAHLIARRPGVIFTSFGDMLRVPGSKGSLLSARADGARVKIVYSPLDALALAVREPSAQVVFFAVGFETTAPACAMAIAQAQRAGVENFSVLVSHVRVPPAMAAVVAGSDNRVDAFLGAGHVAVVEGCEEYEALVQAHRIPIVITGFEPTDLLEGLLMAVRQLEQGRAEVENQYSRVVRWAGNPHAQAVVQRVFEVCDVQWRGLGEIPSSGLRLRQEYRHFDAALRFDVGALIATEPEGCITALVLKGQKKPHQCPSFGTLCTPERPLGATMVSAEGTCAAYYAYRRRAEGAP